MSEEGKNEKRPIDQLRDGAGSFELNTPGDESPISEMISLGDNLLVIKELGIYEFKFADQIDPDRTNIQTPNTIQKILPFGSNTPWVGAVVLTASNLLKKDILESKIDTVKAMLLIIEVAQNISSAIEIADSIEKSQQSELAKCELQIKSDRSFILPSTNGIKNKCKEFLQKTDHALDSLFNALKEFYPTLGKGGWDGLKALIDEETQEVDNFKVVLAQMLPFLHFVRNSRNCVEHPRNEQKITVSDFGIDTENSLVSPLIEVIHPSTSQAPVPVVDFMKQITGTLVDVAELMLAFVCNRHIRAIQGFPVQVHEFPENQRRSKHVKYGYGIATADSVIRFG